MAGEQGAHDVKELTAWLEADDAKGRTMRAKRLRDLLEILPVPSDGLSFLGGEESAIYFDEVRRCYLDDFRHGGRAAVSGVCREGTGGRVICGGLGRCEERPTGSGAGNGLRMRSAV